MNLTTSWLQSNARPAVFERGEALHTRKAIKALSNREGTNFGEVQGTSAYFQTVDFSKTPPLTTCTCPYEDEDFICKHLVAVCLAILANEYTTGDTGNTHKGGSLVHLGKTRDELLRVVEDIITNPDADKGGFSDAAVALTVDINTHLVERRSTDAIRILLAFYEALQRIVVTHPQHALTRIFAGYYQSIFSGILDYFEKNIPETSESKAMIQLVFDRWSRHEVPYEERNHRYDIALFKPLLDVLAAKDPVAAQFLKVRMEAYGF